MALLTNTENSQSTGSDHLDCPLCTSQSIHEFAVAFGRTYLQCQVCSLVFLTPSQRLGPKDELAHYATHRNDPTDLGYRAFLDRLAIPLVERLSPGAEGLDYGSGPGPTLSLMLEERGFSISIYDPFFAPNESCLDRSYDFITATEVIEHFHDPAKEFARFDALLRPNGILGVMTEMRMEAKPFSQWHYPRDPTHVSFYSRATMEWIANRFGWRAEFPRRNVTLFRK